MKKSVGLTDAKINEKRSKVDGKVLIILITLRSSSFERPLTTDIFPCFGAETLVRFQMTKQDARRDH